MIELVLVLNITEILLAVRKAMLNQSSIGGISHFVSQVSNCTGYSPTVGSFLESLVFMNTKHSYKIAAKQTYNNYLNICK